MSPELVHALTWACSTISRLLDRDRDREALYLSIIIEAACRGDR